MTIDLPSLLATAKSGRGSGPILLDTRGDTMDPRAGAAADTRASVVAVADRNDLLARGGAERQFQ